MKNDNDRLVMALGDIQGMLAIDDRKLGNLAIASRQRATSGDSDVGSEIPDLKTLADLAEELAKAVVARGTPYEYPWFTPDCFPITSVDDGRVRQLSRNFSAALAWLRTLDDPKNLKELPMARAVLSGKRVPVVGNKKKTDRKPNKKRFDYELNLLRTLHLDDALDLVRTASSGKRQSCTVHSFAPGAVAWLQYQWALEIASRKLKLKPHSGDLVDVTRNEFVRGKKSDGQISDASAARARAIALYLCQELLGTPRKLLAQIAGMKEASVIQAIREIGRPGDGKKHRNLDEEEKIINSCVELIRHRAHRLLSARRSRVLSPAISLKIRKGK